MTIRLKSGLLKHQLNAIIHTDHC